MLKMGYGRVKNIFDMIIRKRIENVLSLTAAGNHPGIAQELQMMRYGRLLCTDVSDDGMHAELLRAKKHENSNSRGIAKDLEKFTDMRQVRVVGQVNFQFAMCITVARDNDCGCAFGASTSSQEGLATDEFASCASLFIGFSFSQSEHMKKYSYVYYSASGDICQGIFQYFYSFI